MQKLRTQRGITLIALIITIIVMLILVGVSVTVALNGGLFTTAKQATNKTQIEIDKEQLLELALGAMNDKGKVVIGDLDIAVAADERFTGTGGTYTSVKSGKTYTVNGWGGVAEAPVYELSGQWRFVDMPEPTKSETETQMISQYISFTLPSYDISYDDAGEEIVSYNPIHFGEISWNYELGPDALEPDLMVGYSTIAYDHEEVYSSNVGWNNIFGIDNDVQGPIDFGTEPQPVSQEFYDWFIANANPVQE